jgi:hypothetical protein
MRTETPYGFDARYHEIYVGHRKNVLSYYSPCVTDNEAVLSPDERALLVRAAEGGGFASALPRNFCSEAASEIASSVLGRAIPPEAFWRALCPNGWVARFWEIVTNGCALSHFCEFCGDARCGRGCRT